MIEPFNFVRMEERPLHFESFGSSTGVGSVGQFKGIVNPETEKLISVVGAGYKLEHNDEVFPKFEDAIRLSSLNTAGMTRDVSTSHGEGRTVVSYHFPEHRVSIKDGDEMDLTLTVLNSYDMSWRFRSIMGAFRLLCANGLILGDPLAEYSGKHTASLDTDRAIKDLGIALEVYLQNADALKDYPEIAVTPIQIDSIFGALAKGSKTMLKMLDETFNNIYKEEMGNTLWALYNTLTDWSTHAKVKNEANAPSIIINREERVRKILPMLEDIRLAA